MACAAAISLKHTIHRLLNSSIPSSNQEILEFAYVEVKSLLQILKRLDDNNSSSSRKNKRLNALDGEIREAVYKLQDSLSEIDEDLELEEVSQEINSFVEMVKKMEEEFIEELNNPRLPEDDDDDRNTVIVSSSKGFGVEMVGLTDEINGIKKKLLKGTRPDDFGVFWIVGRAGSGRTVVANTIFEESYKQESFDCGAWVTVAQKYEWKEILAAILRQVVDGDGGGGLISTPESPSKKIKTAHPLNPGLGDEELLVENLYTSLKGRKYMIVLDDVCDKKVWEYLRRSFPKQDNGSLVLLTTSVEEVALFSDRFHISRMPDFDEDSAWDLLRTVIFGGRLCPPKLEEIGKKIVKNCQRLRLVLVKVVLSLSRNKKTPEHWINIAADKDDPIFMVADEISEVCRFKEELYTSIPDDDQRASTITMVSRAYDLSRMAVGIKMQMFPKRLHPKMEIFSIFGMAGLGKTTLVKKFFKDPQILLYFDHHAWITLGPNYQSEEFLVDILSKICIHVDKLHLKEDEKLVKDLCTQLANTRCLIVLDDLWSKEPLHCLQHQLPNIKGEIFVTTRLFEVAKCGISDFVYRMHLLDEEQSWLLFCQKMFASDLCPLKLEKAGKRICKNCGDLPLLILTVADLLSEVEKSAEYWEEVAEKKNSVFLKAQAQMSNVLSPSYEYLPQHLKVCFLYMGVFSQDYEIPSSRLIRLWAAEGFLEPNPSQTVKDFVMECLSELVERSLVMVSQKGFKVKTKTCRLHSVFWYLSNSEAVKNNY